MLKFDPDVVPGAAFEFFGEFRFTGFEGFEGVVFMCESGGRVGEEIKELVFDEFFLVAQVLDQIVDLWAVRNVWVRLCNQVIILLHSL